MVRTQIYLTEEEQDALKAIASMKGRTQSEVIREAIDRLVREYRASGRIEFLRAGRGIWSDREAEDFIGIRKELNRSTYLFQDE